MTRAKQLIRQQVFKTKKIPVRNPKTRGILMTTSPIHHITTASGRDWDASIKSPAGVYMDLV